MSGPEAASGPVLTDVYGRTIDYLRLSLTDRCNFRCVYCMPAAGQASVPHSAVLSYEELLRLAAIAANLGISRFKVTGGEPFCRKGAVGFMRRLSDLPGVRQVTVTTNGVLLEKHLDELAGMGVAGVNVSLDCLDPARFAALSRSGESPALVLRAIAAARRLGLAVKINAVPLKGYNEADLPDLVGFALEQGCFLRFIELMPVGEARAFAPVSQAAIRAMVEERFGRLRVVPRPIGNGPAEHYTVGDHAGGVGFISALSKKFCHCCNRLRLTCQGYLKSCLHHDQGVELKALLRGRATDADLAGAMLRAVALKPRAHTFDAGGGAFTMNSVGG